MVHFLASLGEVLEEAVDLLCSGAELVGESVDQLAYGEAKPNDAFDTIGLLGRLVGLSLFIGLSVFVWGLIGLFTGGIRGLFVGIADGFWASAFRDPSGSLSRWDNPFL